MYKAMPRTVAVRGIVVTTQLQYKTLFHDHYFLCRKKPPAAIWQRGIPDYFLSSA